MTNHKTVAERAEIGSSQAIKLGIGFPVLAKLNISSSNILQYVLSVESSLAVYTGEPAVISLISSRIPYPMDPLVTMATTECGIFP